MKIAEWSDLEYWVQGSTEVFENPRTGFMAAWNGAPEQRWLFPSGTGTVIRQGHLALQDTPALAFEDRFFPSWAPPKGEWSEPLDGRVDDKRDTTGTGGSERQYVDTDLWCYLRADDFQSRMRAVQELMAWCTEQTQRPWSMVPFEYGELDKWKASGRGPGTKVGKYNRVDAAHASRSQGYALACLGSDLGLMTCAMEGRVILQDALHSWDYVLSSPRKVAWLLEWFLRLTILRIDFAFLGADPGAILQRLVQTILDHWWEEYPANGPKEDKRTDARVAPQVVGPWPEHPEWEGELHARYSWQRGMLLAMACRVLEAWNQGWVGSTSTEPVLFQQWAEDLAAEVSRAWDGGGGKWSYAYGLTAFDSDSDANAVCARAMGDYSVKYSKEAPHWSGRLMDGKGYAVKEPGNYDYFFRYPFAYLMPDDHPVNQWDDVPRNDRLQYTAPWFRMMEDRLDG